MKPNTGIASAITTPSTTIPKHMAYVIRKVSIRFIILTPPFKPSNRILCKPLYSANLKSARMTCPKPLLKPPEV